MKYALRTLWHDRGFAAMAVLSLVIGIGANTAIFSLVSGVLLRPLDFPDPARLVSIATSTPQFLNGGALPINVGQLVEWRKRTHSFEGIGAYRNITVSLTGRRPSGVDSGGAGLGESLRCAGRAPAFRPYVSRAGGRLRPASGGDAGGFDLAAAVRRRSGDRGAQDYAGGRAVHGGGGSAAGFRIPEAVRRYGQAPERTHGDFPALRLPAESDYCRTTAI